VLLGQEAQEDRAQHAVGHVGHAQREEERVGLLEHDAFFFPLGVAYMAYGVLRAIFLGFLAEEHEADAADIAGPIVIANGEPSTDAYGEHRGGIAPPRRGGAGPE